MRHLSLISVLASSLLAFGCANDTTVFGDGAGGNSGTTTTSSSSSSGGNSGGNSGTTTTTGPGGAGGQGGACGFEQASAGTLCVRGEADPNGGEQLQAGGRVSFEIIPAGCWSSSCTIVHQASCEISRQEMGVLDLSADFCFEVTSTQPCTDDCGGGDTAHCGVMSLEAGSYEARIGDLNVAFDVPSKLPNGGSCAGVLD
jgi:hypothetical protein